MQTKAFHDNYFDSIQALRGAAAIFVVLEHVRFLSCGAFGVDIFFAISGFMMMYTTHRQSRHFLRKRTLRILPLYYAMTIATYLLLLLFPSMFEQTKAEPVFLIKSLLFIPFDIGGGIIQPLLRIGWTVNCEMFFYLLFFIAMKLSHKYRGLICSCLITAVVLAAQLFPSGYAPLNFYGNPVMLEFILGILSYYIARSIYARHIKKTISPVMLPFVLAAAAAIFAVLIFSKPFINISGFRRPLLWGIPGMLLLLCFFVAGLLHSAPRFFVRLGNISFSLYLIHYYPVMFLDRMIFDFSAFTPYAAAGVLFSLLLCIALAGIVWYLVENRKK